MTILRLSARGDGSDTYKVEVQLLEPNQLPRTASSRFRFAMTPQEHEELRWYLEEYLLYPFDPAPDVARRVERSICDVGTALFQGVFPDGSDAGDLWTGVRTRLPAIRVEIATDSRTAVTIPWESIRPAGGEPPLALSAGSFVRVPQRTPEREVTPAGDVAGVRILLVICRPSRTDDVPFRSVAMRVVRSLELSDSLSLQVLRPPTFKRLVACLQEARDAGRPYSIVHFDGHGRYANPFAATPEEASRNLRGFLVFEDANGGGVLVHGRKLGAVLRRAGVSILVLNACRSAYADVLDAPGDPLPDERVGAFGSFAHEAVEAGVLGVVAMRYNVYVATAARFAGRLYQSLGEGESLGACVSIGRQDLARDPVREVAGGRRSLQDWIVPVLYERTRDVLLRAERPEAVPASPPREPQLRGCDRLVNSDGRPDWGDPTIRAPDGTLLELDRAFDTHRVVLLHAFAGSGKTTTAMAFARWYAETGGAEGRPLFTSFKRHQPLRAVVDQLGREFTSALARRGVEWLRISDAERLEEAVRLLSERRALWVWDNVELVAGFPTGIASLWTLDEQRELRGFLSAASAVGCKFLLTSRRDERAWLGDLPARVTARPLPLAESVAIAEALAAEKGRATEVEDWRPLLRFTQGNPLTIRVLVGEALRNGLRTRAEMNTFVAELRAGESTFQEDAREGRSSSLGASLRYGFEHGFTHGQLRKLAILHLFQEFVDIAVLRWMGHPDIGGLAALRELRRERAIALLDRAAEVGLLTKYPAGTYGIHPALPWFFKKLFDRFYRETAAASEAASALAAIRAYVQAVGATGVQYFDLYGQGHPTVVDAVAAEEPNLLHARRLARAQGWWSPMIGATQGLRVLYDHAGRKLEWARLVIETIADFIDPKTDGPLPGREADWSLVTEYRVELAHAARAYDEAERLQRMRLVAARQDASPSLRLPQRALNGLQRRSVHSLATVLAGLGSILRDRGDPACVEPYEEAIALYQRTRQRASEARSCANVGHAYREIAVIRDLDRAERHFERSLALRDERDRHGRGECLSNLGLLAYERFRDARAAERSEEELLRHLTTAEQRYQGALELTPSEAVPDLAVMHHQLGVIRDLLGEPLPAMESYREALRLENEQGDRSGAATTQLAYAVAAQGAGQLRTAVSYAEAALQDFEALGDAYEAERRRASEVLAMLQPRADTREGVVTGGDLDQRSFAEHSAG